jgi:xanthine dehydrogenase small subunit
LDALDGNICRCTGYASILRAVEKLVQKYSGLVDNEKPRIEQLVSWAIVPEYFLTVGERIERILKQKSSINLPKEKKGKIRVAGGTDLYIQFPEKVMAADLDLLSRYPGLSGIRRDNDTIRIGGNTTMEELKQSALLNEVLPEFSRYMGAIASTIIRNRATVAGNIVNASPIGDVTIILIALNAKLLLYSKGKNREIRLNDFFLGYKDINLQKDEVIREITFPASVDTGQFHFEKVSRRKILDIASCNSAICIFTNKGIIGDVRISAGGVAPIPLHLKETSLYLMDKEISAIALKEAVKIAQQEISPISDIRGSKEYKRLLLKQLIFGHFISLFPQQVKPEDIL